MPTPNDCYVELRGLPFHYRDWGGDGRRRWIKAQLLRQVHRQHVDSGVKRGGQAGQRSSRPGFQTALYFKNVAGRDPGGLGQLAKGKPAIAAECGQRAGSAYNVQRNLMWDAAAIVSFQGGYVFC